MLRRSIFLGLTLVGSFACFAAAGCGSSDSTPAGGGAGGSAGSDAGTDDATTDAPAEGSVDNKTDAGTPPGPAEAGAPDGTEALVMGVKTLYLGTSDRQGTPSTDAWKSFGYNLDGYVSTPASTNHCKASPTANPALVKTDGKDGIDNSFGENIMNQIIIGLEPAAEAKVNESIQGGSFTILIKMDNMGTAANYTGVAGSLYAGANFDQENTGATPLFDGTDQWPLTPELLNNNDANDPKVKFPSSYLVDNTWVSGSTGDVALSLAISGYSLDLKIHSAVLSAKLAADRKTATDGVIAGVLNTEELINTLKAVAGRLSPTLCSGSTFDSIAGQIRAASDIMSDGTNGDPTKSCDGISIGLGFDGVAMHLGTVAPAATGGTDPCAVADGG